MQNTSAVLSLAGCYRCRCTAKCPIDASAITSQLPWTRLDVIGLAPVHIQSNSYRALCKKGLHTYTQKHKYTNTHLHAHPPTQTVSLPALWAPANPNAMASLPALALSDLYGAEPYATECRIKCQKLCQIASQYGRENVKENAR